MKKFFMIFAMITLATFAVGCTKNTANNAGPNANNAPAQAQQQQNNAGTQQQAATNNGQVEVSGPTLALAQCMNENGLKMYGTEWCSHCQNQKALFGDAFSYIEYTDCDADRQACTNAGVRGFPTWIDAQGTAYPGTQQLATLAQIAGCEFNG